MTDVAVLLGAEREFAAEQLWSCIEFEKRIANVSKMFWCLTLLSFEENFRILKI